jgi:hypothetical protein
VNKFTVVTLCTIAAKERRQVATVDVKGAFREAFMVNDVFMELERTLTAILVTIFW